MKKLLLIFACSGSILGNAQNTVNITTQQYDVLKKNHQLDLSKNYAFVKNQNNQSSVKPTFDILSSRSSICSCMIPLDTSFSIVPFNGVDSFDLEFRNDDGYTSAITLPFSFNFFGTNYDSVFINNNGNISFISPYYTYTSDSFPSSIFNMIAPFWGDVDTRDSASGIVYYKITPTAMIVKWDNVGYYNSQSDKKNTFQLVITNGSDTLLPSGNNVSFCYGDMQWTTGSASGGVNGFGGSPATAGVNQGNGTDYFQVGRFDQAGNIFDGPYNATDSVDFLDNQGMYFDIASTGNIPPLVINNNLCDTIDVYTGDTLRTNASEAIFKISVSTPEINQTVSASLTCNAPANFSYVMSMNTPTFIEYTCTFTSQNLAENFYYVTVVASDNGSPVKQTTNITVIKNTYDPSIAGIKENKILAIEIYPNPSEGLITVKHKFNAISSPILNIVNVIGGNVLTTGLNSQQQTIDINSLAKGVYFAKVTSKEGESKIFKIIRK